MEWKNKDYLFGTTKKFVYESKLACFDLDGTLINTKSGKRFPIDGDDWDFYSKNTKKKLRELFDSDYSIIIISNQAGLKTTNKINEWKGKIESIQKLLKIELIVFASLKTDIYRKPSTKFYELIKTQAQKNKIKINDTKSFYCGDAYDSTIHHSDCDYKFALNCQISFFAADNYFNNNKVNIPKIIYKPFENLKNKKNVPFIPIKNNKNELIIFCGYPGSGKSFYTINKILPHNYKRINQDELKTKIKCLKETQNLIKNKHNIVIDNTNSNIKTRNEYIELAQKAKYTIRCFNMKTSQELSKHNSLYRMHKDNKQPIPELVYRCYNKKYEKPTLDEGFEEIIDIYPENIDDPLYNLYLF